MRTTLEIEDDLLATSKQLARQRGVTLGKVISDLARQSLIATTPPKYRNGARLLEPRPGGGRKIDLEFVNELRDEE